MAVKSSDKKKMGKWIKQLRESHKPYISQRQLALAVDITNASLSSIENGSIFPSEELFLKLLNQLQPSQKKRNEMLALFAEAKGTPPPDINSKLSSNSCLWEIVRQLIELEPSEEERQRIVLELDALARQREEFL